MPDHWIGRTLSKVQIQQLIGRGGMADVYLGRHVTLNVGRAVKILHGNLADDPDLRRRFNEEAKAVAALRHPNIVQVYDLDLYDGTPYIVMELLQGLSMAAYLQQLHDSGHALAFETAARVLDGLAAALDFAHAQGIVHRDIKPANVILREGSTPIRPSLPLPPDATPILTDFGIARISSSTTQTLTGTVLGTPAYMSPEQVRGEPADSRADIYSLGIMLFEWLAGTLPFNPDVDTTASILYKQANVAPPPLPNVDPAIQAVVSRALQKNPDDRYPKAGDLASAFRRAARLGPTTVVQPISSPLVTEGNRSRVQPWWIVLAGAGVTIVGGLAILIGTRGPGLAGALPSTPTFAPATPAEAPAPRSSPTASVVAPVVEAAGSAIFQDASAQIVVEDVPAPEASQVYSVWLISPDGQSIALPADYADGAIRAAYVDTDGVNLLARTSSLAISLEPSPDPAPRIPTTIVYTAELPASVVAEARRLDDLSRGLPTTQAIVEGLQGQAATHDSHLQFAVEALVAGNLADAKAHAEHAINILVGQDSAEFDDWDGNGRTENPGDGFGLIAYVELARSLIESELENPIPDPGAADGPVTLLQDFGGLLEHAETSVRLAQRIAASDTVQEAQSIAETWATLRLAASASDTASRVEDESLRLFVSFRAEP